jgi:hypothetical protein
MLIIVAMSSFSPFSSPPAGEDEGEGEFMSDKEEANERL